MKYFGCASVIFKFLQILVAGNFYMYDNHIHQKGGFTMKYESLSKHYGEKEAIAAALGISVQTVINWRESKKIPMPAQKRIAMISNGALKIDKVKK